VGFCADLNVKGSQRPQKLKEANESSRFFICIGNLQIKTNNKSNNEPTESAENPTKSRLEIKLL
jgi:hypothetical protein